MAIVGTVEDGVLLDNTGTTSTSKSETTGSTDMGYEQFLQLLCAEMQYQDPLEPTTNTEYVAQMATFSQLEATLSMKSTMEQSSATDLVGKSVIVQSSSGDETTATAGYVDYVQYENGNQYMYINGNPYSVDDLYQVADSTYMEAVTLAEAFKNSVDQLPDADDLSLAWKDDVANLASVYSALTSYQQSYVDSDTLTKFQNLVAKINELEAAQQAAAVTDDAT
jgi:flagellar basal-body rod modification protein FlgD